MWLCWGACHRHTIPAAQASRPRLHHMVRVLADAHLVFRPFLLRVGKFADYSRLLPERGFVPRRIHRVVSENFDGFPRRALSDRFDLRRRSAAPAHELPRQRHFRLRKPSYPRRMDNGSRDVARHQVPCRSVGHSYGPSYRSALRQPLSASCRASAEATSIHYDDIALVHRRWDFLLHLRVPLQTNARDDTQAVQALRKLHGELRGLRGGQRSQEKTICVAADACA